MFERAIETKSVVGKTFLADLQARVVIGAQVKILREDVFMSDSCLSPRYKCTREDCDCRIHIIGHGES